MVVILAAGLICIFLRCEFVVCFFSADFLEMRLKVGYQCGFGCVWYSMFDLRDMQFVWL